jgi:hypothetical protein
MFVPRLVSRKPKLKPKLTSQSLAFLVSSYVGTYIHFIEEVKVRALWQRNFV